MKRSGPIKRKTRLKPNPDTQRAWEERTREKALERQRSGAGEPRRSPTRRTPIKPVSKQRAKENRQRSAMLREKYGPAPVLCERCGQAEANDAHEIVPRSAGGSITNPSNVRAVCRDCHDWIHDNPSEAAATGWLKARF